MSRVYGARIAVTDEELAEAKCRRALVRDALVAEFGGRVYFNGSVAHGDANYPLTDFDIGIVPPDPSGEYEPGVNLRVTPVAPGPVP